MEYPPGQNVEAQQRAERTKQEAQFYDHFLNGVRTDVIDRLTEIADEGEEDIDLNETSNTLSDMGFNADDISEILSRNMRHSQEVTGVRIDRVGVSIPDLLNMTPLQFVKHIEEARASLAKH